MLEYLQSYLIVWNWNAETVLREEPILPHVTFFIFSPFMYFKQTACRAFPCMQRKTSASARMERCHLDDKVVDSTTFNTLIK